MIPLNAKEQREAYIPDIYEFIEGLFSHVSNYGSLWLKGQKVKHWETASPCVC